jgi:hypothetical protein
MTIKILPELKNFVRPSPHSTFSPSAADRWFGCAYSVNAAKAIPEETSKYAEEGTLAHSVCEAVFYEQYLGTKFPIELSMDMLAYNGDEMMECAHGYSEVVTYWLNNKEQIGEILYYGLERGIPIFPEEGCFGTADCLIIGTKSAVVIDYKHGKGKNVSANTLQLKVYASGIARYLAEVPEGYKVYAVVYQPRTDQAPKETSYTMPELNQCLGQIWEAIQASKGPFLAPVEGSHCFWCPASRTKDLNLKCSIMKEKPLKLAQENFGKFLADMAAPVEKVTDPNPKRDEAIIKIMGLYPLMKKIVEDCTDEFLMRLQSGEVIEGVRIIDKLGNRVLNAETDKEKAELITSKFKVDPWKVIPETKKIRTLTEIEKEIGKGKLDSVCVRKVSKSIDILDDKMRSILGEMAAYGQMINNGNTSEE